MTVYVVNPTHDDISSAEQYGDFKFINQHYITADRVESEEIPREFDRAMFEAARKFHPQTDYLLIVGDHLQLITMSAYLSLRHDFFRVLRYDRQAKGYYPVMVRVYTP